MYHSSSFKAKYHAGSLETQFIIPHDICTILFFHQKPQMALRSTMNTIYRSSNITLKFNPKKLQMILFFLNYKNCIDISPKHNSCTSRSDKNPQCLTHVWPISLVQSNCQKNLIIYCHISVPQLA